MIKRMVLALTLMLMVPFIQVNGKTISSTERAKKVGQMAVATMVVIVMVKSMDRQLTGGQMAQFMRVIGQTTKLKGKVRTTGLMVGGMLEIG